MNDLILRAAAIGCLGNSPEQMCMPWSEVERILRELPAVDAIPVEWLREFDLYYAGISGGSPYMKALIEAWQKGQEATC